MVLPTTNPAFYRPAAAVAVFNGDGKVWLGRRKGGSGRYVWQMPQGGREPGEPPCAAAYRELHEETGMQEQQLVYLGRIEDELFYDFPPQYMRTGRGWNWLGQRQSWFAMRFTGTSGHIDLKAHPPQEFSQWRWAKLSEVSGLVIPFKRRIYERVMLEFADFAKPCPR
ncbi:MAG: RNA pyrophosphohydrolase [Hyphomonadaceae bacterium]|nr:RNA pyrophosphohydrolase [Hyphomonadaceae bacterium]MBC6413070.1 RNA pyrophosphohydrolase [Hyphomonadaceae bacterium]